MSVTRHYTVGAVVPNPGSLKALDERLADGGVPGDALVVLCRRRDEPLVNAVLPEARTRRVEAGLARLQWFEFASTYIGVTAVSVLLGAIHLLAGIIVQAVMTLAAATGLLIYHRRPRLRRKLLGMGLPEKLAEEWEAAFPQGFALALAVVPEDRYEAAQDAFLDDPGFTARLVVDRRPVL
ncbi:MAG: hypothetical protein AB1425_04610 [Actinomycetota bacterium]